MTTSVERNGVCEWCGATFVAPNPRGRIPKFCKRSHRTRAHEQRTRAGVGNEVQSCLDQLGAAFGCGTEAVVDTARQLLVAARQGAPPEMVAGTAEHDQAGFGGATLEQSSATATLQPAVVAAAGASPTSPAELRRSVAALAGAIRQVLRDASLPETPPETIGAWRLVVPVNEALQRADATLVSATRSAPKLVAAQRRLLSAAAALMDPAAAQAAVYDLPLRVGVPGPDRQLRCGTFMTDVDGQRKVVMWSPDENVLNLEALPVVAGRHAGAHYRWKDNRVWEELARDMVVVACGWRSCPDRLPLVLRRNAVPALAVRLHQDLAGSEWALSAATIVRWLSVSGHITVVGQLARTAADDEGGLPARPRTTRLGSSPTRRLHEESPP